MTKPKLNNDWAFQSEYWLNKETGKRVRITKMSDAMLVHTIHQLDTEVVRLDSTYDPPKMPDGTTASFAKILANLPVYVALRDEALHRTLDPKRGTWDKGHGTRDMGHIPIKEGTNASGLQKNTIRRPKTSPKTRRNSH